MNLRKFAKQYKIYYINFTKFTNGSRNKCLGFCGQTIKVRHSHILTTASLWVYTLNVKYQYKSFNQKYSKSRMVLKAASELKVLTSIFILVTFIINCLMIAVYPNISFYSYCKL